MFMYVRLNTNCMMLLYYGTCTTCYYVHVQLSYKRQNNYKSWNKIGTQLCLNMLLLTSPSQLFGILTKLPQ